MQELDNAATTPTVEYIRGSDYGGGIGGILYTLRGGSPSYTHENRRGDVVAKTDSSGSLTHQATYEALGKRTQEQGSTQDRQKANTKDEDPTGLLNEGFRYRDLETGSFITTDPAGFVDGPNLYTYVNQNPWTHFDAEGLKTESDYYKENEGLQKKLTAYQHEKGNHQDEMDAIRGQIRRKIGPSQRLKKPRGISRKLRNRRSGVLMAGFLTMRMQFINPLMRALHL